MWDPSRYCHSGQGVDVDRVDWEKLERKERQKIVILWIVVLVPFVIAVILGMFLRSAHAHQQEMQAQLDHQAEMLSALHNQQGDTVEENEVVTITSETLRNQLNSLSELVTQEYIYTNADKRESKETWVFGWNIPFSGNSLLVTYDGTIKAGIDLSQAKIDVDGDKHTITVTLPASRVTDNDIPQETINVVEVKDGLFNKVSFDNYNDFISEQKIVMEERAINQGLLSKADEEAKTLIKSFLSVLPGMDSYTLIVQ